MESQLETRENALPSIQASAVRALKGDKSAFDELHRKLTGPLTGFFLKSTGCPAHVAEELAHQTLAESLQLLAAGTYVPDRASFLTFVYGVSRNVRLRYFRQSNGPRVSQISDLTDEEKQQISAQVSREETSFPLSDEIEAMRACLRADGCPNSLTPEERFVIVSRADRKTFAVIAKQLRCSLDTVFRRQARALQKLRRCMNSKGHRWREDQAGESQPRKNRKRGV